MRIGIATDHGGFGLKEELLARLRAAGQEAHHDRQRQRLRGGRARRRPGHGRLHPGLRL